MDDVFLPEESRETIKDVFDMLDQAVSDTLWQMSYGKRKDFEEDLIVRFEHKDLKEIRIKIFRAALDKVDSCLSQVARARITNTDDIDIDDDVVTKADTLLRVLSPQDMINRRCVKKMANDITELLSFIANDKVELPTDMIKSATADIPLGKDLRQAVACIQKIVTSDACRAALNASEITTGNESTHETGEESESSMDVGEAKEMEEESLSDGTFIDDGDANGAEIIRSDGTLDDSEYDLIRALTGTGEDNSQITETIEKGMGHQVQSIQEEMGDVDLSPNLNDPICPLIVVSETSPVPVAPCETNGGNVNSLTICGGKSNMNTPLDTQRYPSPMPNDSYANCLNTSKQSYWIGTRVDSDANPTELDQAERNRADRVSLDTTYRVSVTIPTLIEKLPPNDKSSSTADLWEHIKATWKEGKKRVILDYDDPEIDENMSGNDGRRPWPKRRENQKKGDACRECGKNSNEPDGWRDDVDRRMSNAENLCTEKMRMMAIMREEIDIEMRDMRRRLDVLDGPKNNLFIRPRPAAVNPEHGDTDPHVEPTTMDVYSRGRPSKCSNKKNGTSDDLRKLLRVSLVRSGIPQSRAGRSK